MSQCERHDLPSTERCEDGNSCTGPDFCDGAGNCNSGATATCPSSTACATYSCDGDGGCPPTYADTSTMCRDFTTCRDGNCDGAGRCVGTTSYCAMECPTGECFKGTCSCDGATGACIPDRKPDGTPCNLGMGCNFACSSGSCEISPVSCPPAGCFTYYCDGTTCRPNTALDAGTPCDDGDPCTVSSSCLEDGGCGAGTPKVCPASGPCTRGICNPADGGCSNLLLGDGTVCGPGDAGHCSGLSCVLPDGGVVNPETDAGTDGTVRVNPFSCGCSSSGAMGALFLVIALALFSSNAGRRSRENA